jgi:hypothetical protein
MILNGDGKTYNFRRLPLNELVKDKNVFKGKLQHLTPRFFNESGTEFPINNCKCILNLAITV